MLQGHVDNISRQALDGWAADAAAPDRTIDVAILVNARLVAQLACDRPREDLQRTGQYGTGSHGFAYRFAEPLPQGAEARVTVLFSETGVPLGRGDWKLDETGAVTVDPAEPPPAGEPVMMPAPRDPRALFELLYWYHERAGLYPLLSRLDVAGQRPQHIHYGVLGRYPDQQAATAPPSRYYPREHLNELILSDEFQETLLPRLAEAFADKRRLIFVHIPKCAGTDLTNKLKTRYPWLDHNIMDPKWTTKHDMLRHLSRLAVHLRFAENLYLCGHGGLDYYLGHRLIRPNDQIFTVVRHPLEIAVSQINYVLTRFWQDAAAGAPRPDTVGWLRLIGRDALPATISDDFVRETAPLILRNRNIVPPNGLCFWLAGRNADAGAALAAMVSSDIEITDTAHYNAWLARRWGIVSDSRDNASMKFVTLDTLSAEQQDYLREISQEDVTLYQTIEHALAAPGRVSVFGRDLEPA